MLYLCQILSISLQKHSSWSFIRETEFATSWIERRERTVMLHESVGIRHASILLHYKIMLLNGSESRQFWDGLHSHDKLAQEQSLWPWQSDKAVLGGLDAHDLTSKDSWRQKLVGPLKSRPPEEVKAGIAEQGTYWTTKAKHTGIARLKSHQSWDHHK